MSLKDFIERDYTSVNADTKIKDVAKLMHRDKVGAVIVVKKFSRIKKIPVGIITDRDIAIYMGETSTFNLHDPVEKAMTSNVILGREEDGVAETIQKMKANGIKRLPVVNNRNHLVGMIDSDDIYSLIGKELEELSLVYKTKNVKKLNTTWAKIPETNEHRQLILI